MKVSKKVERLARALAEIQLLNVGFPRDLILERTDESWMCYHEQAMGINKAMNTIEDYELDGEFSKEQLEHWTS